LAANAIIAAHVKSAARMPVFVAPTITLLQPPVGSSFLDHRRLCGKAYGRANASDPLLRKSGVAATESFAGEAPAVQNEDGMDKAYSDALMARLLHHRGARLAPGEPIGPQIAPAAVFHLPGDPGNAPFQYGRFHNPTWEALEEALSVLEDAEAVLFPSGMAAIAALLFSFVKAGDRVLLPADGYYTTRVLASEFLAGLGAHIETRRTTDFTEGGFNGFRLVVAETPSNPGLDVCDIAAIAKQTKTAGALFAVDNTTATALGQRPLDLGADLVVCADTKAVNGHSDVLLGHVASRDGAFIARVRDWRKYAGAIPGPFEAWLVYRGLETLEVRYDRMCASAATIAERLAEHRNVAAIRFPGLKSDPAHAIASKQMSRFGFLISLTLADKERAERFIDACPCIQPSTSFGGVRTSAERRARWGDAVAEGFIRLSVGVEPTEPLWSAIEAALG
jgi:cystathionine gamma-lyase